MSGRADYLIQVLEKIGAPLMAGLINTPDPHAADDDVTAQAQKIASLLSSSVKFSIDIGNLIDINSAGADGDRLRIALTALASPLVAEYYKHGGKAPDEAQIKKMTAALQAVITFSDNFTSDDASTQALENTAVKTLETNVNYIEALLPVVSAVGAFAFGQSEAALLQDVSGKLSQSARSLCATLLPAALPEAEQKKAELAVLRCLARLYANAHNGGVAKLMALDEDKRMNAAISLDTVWSVFETNLSMIRALAENMVPGAASAGAPAAPAPAPPPAAETAPEAPPEARPAEEQQTPPPAQTPAASPASANPMAMFAKKPAASSETPSAAPPAPPSAPPPAPPPAEVPLPAPPEVPANQQPATPSEPPAPPTEIPPPLSEPPAATPPQDNPADKPVDKPSGSPMSFFKALPKKEEGDDNA